MATKLVFSLAVAAALVAAGCATIMQGTTQSIGVSSNPAGGTITVNNVQQAGATPMVLELKRNQNHVITIELDGYRPYSTTLTRSLSGWVLGNVIFGGVIGLVVDAAAGGMYKLSPEQVVGNLNLVQSGHSGEDMLYIGVVLFAEESWEKVGQLEPAVR